jgi:preprotein translocase subunit YajC
MTRAQADRLAEGDRVKTKELIGTVVGATKNCVSIQWDGRTTPEIFTTDDMRNISKDGPPKDDRK